MMEVKDKEDGGHQCGRRSMRMKVDAEEG